MKLAVAIFSLFVLAAGPPVITYWPQSESSTIWKELPPIAGCELQSWNLELWRPYIAGSHISNEGSYNCNGNEVFVSIHYFLTQRQGAETVGGENRILPVGVRSQYEEKELADTGVTVNAHTVWLDTDTILRALIWYAVGQRPTNKPFTVKLLDARNVLLFRRDPSVIIVVAGLGEDPKRFEEDILWVAGNIWSQYLTTYLRTDSDDV